MQCGFRLDLLLFSFRFDFLLDLVLLSLTLVSVFFILVFQLFFLVLLVFVLKYLSSFQLCVLITSKQLQLSSFFVLVFQLFLPSVVVKYFALNCRYHSDMLWHNAHTSSISNHSQVSSSLNWHNSLSPVLILHVFPVFL